VYYAIQGSPNSKVYRKGHTVSATVPPELLFSTSSFPTWMVLRGGTFYWISSTGSPPFYVYKRSATAPPTDLGTQVTQMSEGAAPIAFTATSTTIFWVEDVAGSYLLRQLALTGTAAITAATPAGLAFTTLHADQAKVYWGVRFPVDVAGVYSTYFDGPTTRLTSIYAASAVPDAVSDQVYFGDGFSVSPLYKVSKSGGTAVEISPTFLGYDFVGTDARFVFARGGWGSFSPVYEYVK
jgi:hypothetical protein